MRRGTAARFQETLKESSSLLRRSQAPHLRRFTRSRIPFVHPHTLAVRSVAERPGYSTWLRLATSRQGVMRVEDDGAEK